MNRGKMSMWGSRQESGGAREHDDAPVNPQAWQEGQDGQERQERQEAKGVQETQEVRMSQEAQGTQGTQELHEVQELQIRVDGSQRSESPQDPRDPRAAQNGESTLSEAQSDSDLSPPGDAVQMNDVAIDFNILLAESADQAKRLGALRDKLRRKAAVYRIVAFVAVAAGLMIVLYPMLYQTYNAYKFAMLAEQSNRTVAQWPYPQAEEALAKAREYNRKLYATGPHNIGELNDPYSQQEHEGDLTDALGQMLGVQSGPDTSETSTSAQDEEYSSILNQGGGVIGSVEIPVISVKLPVYHGTSSSVLNSGAGHLYGTSFPVDEPGSHTVITAHRGLPTAMFFTRLGELDIGDEMYVTTMGKTFGYIVDRIEVIEPTDISKLGLTEGEERLTLMTCTPYGINSHRLLVSGLRGNIPQPVSPLPDARRDILWIPVCAVIALVASLICAWIARRRRQAMRFMRARHALWLPWW
ncbi:class C sortase [Bifidobacterium crudilactis]|jgi:sortase A|uniref:class C sortase n=1 Tax=Bifidobacterium crudilactis TaxID=327277 RepID=UPI002F360AA6